ncbi:MAG: hypothetical protein Kow0098_03530 [Ignavibacteriaceae bacterium]
MANGIWINENKFVSFAELNSKDLSQQIFSRAQSAEFWTAIFQTLPDPDILLQKSGNWIETFNKMMNDPHIFSEFEKRKALTLSLDFKVIKRSASEKQTQIIEDFINSNDHELFSELKFNERDEEDANIYDLIDVGLDAVPHGMQPVEVVWEQIGTMFLPVKLIDRPRRWFHFDADNNLRFKSKASPIKGEPVAQKKVLIFRNKPRYDNPYGQRVLSRCFWPWMFKHTTEKWKIQFLEKFATVWAIGKLPRGKENKDYDNMYDSLVNLINSAIGIIPDDGSVELHEPAGKGQTSNIFDGNIKLYNEEMSKAILTVTSLTGSESKGSYASDEVRERMLRALVAGDKKIILKQTDRLFEWIFEINGWGSAPVSDLVEPVDYMKRAELDTKLKGLGVNLSRSYFINKYALTEDDFENSSPESKVEFAETSDPAAVLIKSLPSKSLQQLIEPVVGKVIDAFRTSKNFDEAMEKATELVPGVSTDEIEELITKLNFLSFVTGAADAEQQ